MCLFKKVRKCFTAKSDILCYKILDSDLKSEFYKFQYIIDKPYKKIWDTSFIRYANSHRDLGGNMFHAGLDKNKLIYLYGQKIISKDNVQLSENQILVKCIIPKGSRYYLGLYSEVGCEKIIIKEICH